MSRWWLVAFALVMYLIFVVATLPAQFGLWLLPPQNNLHVGRVSGSVWQGEIGVVHWQGKLIKDVQWDINIGQLLLGRLEADIIAGQDMTSDIAVTGTAGMSLSGWYAKDLEVMMPASVAAELSPMPLQVELEGMIDAQITAASQGTPWCTELDGLVTWRNPKVIAAALGNPFKLDNTRATLTCVDGEIVAKVDDDKQVIGLDVSATLAAQSYSVSGTLNPGPQFPQGFEQGLMFVATPIGNNRYQIELDGSL
ncbi:type II secretion system protein N [Neiella sp. HB171785]|uniref:Type II secretion system protein N n=1 Tax=Neiella litorisoli TaxID=2771431 RepID=A0A8J6QS81_9GAMM|nr:type II secretion system protein N [Neiella litorisoli]MBD1391101.1 type II secretion system protein N [Neiella litorisoli]